MPTAGKLFGAVSFALLCWFVSGFIPPLLPEGVRTDFLQPINAGIGFLMGWMLLGKNAGDGIVASIGHSSTTMVAIVFWALLIWSGDEMLENSVRLRYNGPVEALQDMAITAIEYARLIATPEIIGSMIVGIVVCAIVTEWAAARWS